MCNGAVVDAAWGWSSGWGERAGLSHSKALEPGRFILQTLVQPSRVLCKASRLCEGMMREREEEDKLGGTGLTPPPPPWRRDHVLCIRKAKASETQLLSTPAPCLVRPQKRLSRFLALSALCLGPHCLSLNRHSDSHGATAGPQVPLLTGIVFHRQGA